MELGWIKLHRSIRKNWIWSDAKKLKWWLDLLMMANHKDNKLLIGNELLIIKRGSLHTSIINLSTRWDADKKTVKKFLTLLEKDNMITLNSSSIGTTINISNYNGYQDFNEGQSPMESTSMSNMSSTLDEAISTPLNDHDSSSKALTSKSALNSTSVDIPSATLNGFTSPPSKDNTMTYNDTIIASYTMANANNFTATMDIPKPVNFKEFNGMETNNNINNINNINNYQEGKKEKELEEDIKKENVKALSSKVPISNKVSSTSENSILENPILENSILENEAKVMDASTPSQSKPMPIFFPTSTHEKIFNALGEIAYKTWFMDSLITPSEKSIEIQVDSAFKKEVITSKFRIKLGMLLGKTVFIEMK